MECCRSIAVTLRDESFRRWLQFAFCFLSVSFVAGVVYGWPSLRQQLLDDGSSLDEATLGAIFTVGAWSTQGGRFFAGIARDRFGTRAVTVGCVGLAAMGSLGIALCNPNEAVGLSVSLFLVGLGSGVQLCAQPVAGLFPQTSGMMMTILSGAFQISGLVIPALTAGRAMRIYSFSGYAGCLLLLGVLSLWLLPQGKSFVRKEIESLVDATQGSSTKVSRASEEEIDEMTAGKSSVPKDTESVYATQGDENLSSKVPDPSDEEANETLEVNRESQLSPEKEDYTDAVRTNVDSQAEDAASSVSSYTHVDAVDVGPLPIETTESLPPTSLEQMKSAEYIFLCSWFSICLVPLQYYIGSIGFQLKSKGDDGFYTYLFSITYAAATLVSPAGGFLADRFSLGVAQGVATTLCAGSLFVLAASSSLYVQVAGLLMYSVGRLLVFAMYFANCGKRFGYANFGTLAGLGLLVSSLVSILQYPLISLAAHGNADAINFGSAALLLALSPYFIWLHRREKGRL